MTPVSRAVTTAAGGNGSTPHEHPENAAVVHVHPEYVHSHPFADDTHTHPEYVHVHDFASPDHTHAEAAHDHDGDYAPFTHLHNYVDTNDVRLTDSRLPMGGAGGVLAGTYPNPGFAVDMTEQSEFDAHKDAAAPHSGHAPLVHTHPYADPAHTHAGFAPAVHNHDYAASDHTHPGGAHPDLAAHDALGLATQVELDGHAHDLSGYSTTSHTHTITDSDIPLGIARDAEVSAAVTTHEQASDPHPTYLTQPEADARYNPIGGGGSDPRIQTVSKPSAQALTGTAVQDVAGFSFPVVAGGVYTFRLTVDITAVSGTSPTINFQFTGPTIGTGRISVKRSQMTSATAIATSVVTAFATNMGAGAAVANTKHTFEGNIVVGATGGTVQLRATLGGTVPNVTIGAGSGGHVVKVA